MPFRFRPALCSPALTALALAIAACGSDGGPAEKAPTVDTDAATGGSPGTDADAKRPGPTPCSELDAEALGLEGTTFRVTEEVTSGSLQPEGVAAPFENLPPLCRVAGTVEASIEFEVWLPLEGYNGRLVAFGNGGMAGSIGFGGMSISVTQGFGVLSTDTGHTVTGSFDASWALGRPDLIEDFGHRSLHVTTIAAKRIAAALTGEPADYAYFVGCSKGGQQAMMEAQRYPEDFDGIVAGNPAHDWTRFYAGGHLWYSLATLADPESYIPADKLPILANAVDAACDAADGVDDGIVQDPRECDFDPVAVLCEAGADPATCFTDKQVEALRKIYGGSVDASGATIFPGLSPGSESAGWDGWLTGIEPFGGLHYQAANDFFRFMVFDDPSWDFTTFDFETDLAFALEKVGPALDADDPDLSAFRDRGGKLLHYHGWADPDISPQSSIDYYDAVVSHFGSPAEVDDWYRLFMAPGMGHCIGGPGPDGFQTLSVIQAWVEDGVAPERIVATKSEGGTVVRSRPLCPHPAVARWNGVGSVDEEGSFDCVTP